MNDLIKIETTSENPTVLGRDLHAALGVETPYRIWFPRMADYGFTDGADYLTVNNSVRRADGTEMPQTQADHQLTLDMAKELCMLQRSDKGKECRQYFIELEKKWNSPELVMSRALQMAQKQIASLNETNAKLLPLAQFAESVTDSKDVIDIGTVAKVLNRGIGRNRLFEVLRQNGILMSDNTPYQKYVDEGWFRCIETKYTVGGETRIHIKTVVFQKGVKKIGELIGKVSA